MTQEFVTLPREVVEQALAALDAEDPYRAAIALRAALEQPQRKLTPQDIADSALLGNIESPFNACMHQEHCKRWKAQAEQHVADHQRESSIDNDLPSENGQLITTSSSVPFGYKLAPVEPTVEMLRAGCGSESPAMFRESLTDKQIDAIADAMPGGLEGFMKGWGWRQFARAVLEAAPQPTTVKECLTDELKPRFSAHDDAERLKSVARGMSYNDHGEAVWKHTLMEIAVRLESGGYAAPQPPALEQQVEKESTCKDSLQVEQAAVAWLATYTGKVGEPLVYVTSSYELAVENDRNQSPKPLYLHQQNLNCKSNQKRLATLWGYVKAEQSSAVQQPQGEQEPVAVVDFTTEGWRKIVDALRTLPDGAQLYTRPQNLQCKSTQARLATLWGYVKEQPKLEPLTDEQILHYGPGEEGAVWSYEDQLYFARAIEAAHNIK